MVYFFQPALEPKGITGKSEPSIGAIDDKFGRISWQRREPVEASIAKYYPKEVVVKPREGKLRDLVVTQGMLCVSQRVKDLIESLEPDIHQFLPVTLRYGRDEHKYFLLKIGCSMSNFDLERSNVHWSEIKLDDRTLQMWTKKTVPMVFAREKVGQQHLWQAEKMQNLRFMSDQLHDLFEANGIDGFEYQRQVVD